MAKPSSLFKTQKQQKKMISITSGGFSLREINAALQLFLLSRDRINKSIISTCSGKEEDNKATDHDEDASAADDLYSSITTEEVFEKEEAHDGCLERRNKRFRALTDIYNVTDEMSLVSDHAAKSKRIRLLSSAMK